MDISFIIYSNVFKYAFLLTTISSLLVIINAILSSKALGGTLGQGMRKIAVGTIFHTIIIATYFLLEQGNRGLLNDDQVKLFFITFGLLGSTFLILGYSQIYKIAKKLKLFTV